MKNIAILDFGSQYTQLIGRRLRELGVFCEILPFDVSIEKLEKLNPSGIILSGGPNSVFDSEAPLRDLFELSRFGPLLGICYGMQLMALQAKGKVELGSTKEYGRAQVQWQGSWQELGTQDVWMSHGDHVAQLPDGFECLAKSRNGLVASMKKDSWLGLQFHPEVQHTKGGGEILKKFAVQMCGVEPEWTTQATREVLLKQIRSQVPAGEEVLCAMSGGVDSTVLGVLVTEALGAERVHCVFVNNGLLRKNEFEEVKKSYSALGLNLHAVEATDVFLKNLENIEDPEAKRKIIGRTFVEVFEERVKSHFPRAKFLAQGTLYPDVIESVSPRGTSVTIKSHHNVGGLPEKMNLRLLEPFRELFKDEVRKLGEYLGISKALIQRHPFPGPGLAVRILGAVSREDLRILQEVDALFVKALKDHGLYEKIWQAFSVLLPVKSVGVQGDGRSYCRVVALRAVTSTDGMTADWFNFDGDFLRTVSTTITNQVPEVNRVVYDISSKPPATIEWE